MQEVGQKECIQLQYAKWPGRVANQPYKKSGGLPARRFCSQHVAQTLRDRQGSHRYVQAFSYFGTP